MERMAGEEKSGTFSGMIGEDMLQIDGRTFDRSIAVVGDENALDGSVAADKLAIFLQMIKR